MDNELLIDQMIIQPTTLPVRKYLNDVTYTFNNLGVTSNDLTASPVVTPSVILEKEEVIVTTESNSQNRAQFWVYLTTALVAFLFVVISIWVAYNRGQYTSGRFIGIYILNALALLLIFAYITYRAVNLAQSESSRQLINLFYGLTLVFIVCWSMSFFSNQRTLMIGTIILAILFLVAQIITIWLVDRMTAMMQIVILIWLIFLLTFTLSMSQ